MMRLVLSALLASCGQTSNDADATVTGKACATWDRTKFEQIFRNPPSCMAAMGEPPECVAWAKTFGLNFTLFTECAPSQDAGLRCTVKQICGPGYQCLPMSAAAPTASCDPQQQDPPSCRALFDAWVLGGHVPPINCMGYAAPAGKGDCSLNAFTDCQGCQYIAAFADGGVTPQICVKRASGARCEAFCQAQ